MTYFLVQRETALLDPRSAVSPIEKCRFSKTALLLPFLFLHYGLTDYLYSK